MSKKKAIGYTDEQRESLIDVLEDMHGNPYEKEGSEIKKRVFVVMAFTEYNDGIAGSIGCFGSKGISLTGDMKQDAEIIGSTDLATIASAMAAKEIEPKLDKWTRLASDVKQGAKFWLEEEDAKDGDTVKCCFCKAEIPAIRSNNPSPASEVGRCCNDCNNTVVIPARLATIGAST